MVKRVTISLPDKLAASIDAEAESLSVSRSELVQEAAAHYLAHAADERRVDERRRHIEQAIEDMKGIGASWTARDPRPSHVILREIRDFDGGGPPLDASDRAAWEAEVGYDAWLRELEGAE